MADWMTWGVRGLWAASMLRIGTMADASWFDFCVAFVAASCVLAMAEWVIDSVFG